MKLTDINVRACDRLTEFLFKLMAKWSRKASHSCNRATGQPSIPTISARHRIVMIDSPPYSVRLCRGNAT